MKDKLTIYIVIVLYNKYAGQSISLRRVDKISGVNIEITIIDNSTIQKIQEENAVFCQNKGHQYIGMSGNKGLSKAYNAFLNQETYRDMESGIVVWMDDDTAVNQKYFDELYKEAMGHKEVDIFVPVIQGQDGRYWSPNRSRFFRNKQLKNPKQMIPDGQFNAINSCTAVRLQVYKAYRYDEKLFLDQVDHNFFRDMRNQHRHFLKLNIVLKHNFALKTRMSSMEQVKMRYKIMIPDFLTYCSKTKLGLILGMIKVGGWGIRESIQYKNLYFCYWCIREGLHVFRRLI